MKATSSAAANSASASGWVSGTFFSRRSRAVPPLLKTVAARGSGLGELVEALELLRARPVAERAARRRRQAARQIVAIAGERARARAEAALAATPAGTDAGAVLQLGPTVDAVASRTLDPWSAADQLLEVLKYQP